MPRRKRVQEYKRRFARAIAQAEAEVAAEDAVASASPLDDIFWRDHESPWCQCSDNRPADIEAAARQEIDAHLKGTA